MSRRSDRRRARARRRRLPVPVRYGVIGMAVIVIGGLVLWQTGREHDRRRAGAPDTLSAADDRDGDGRPDPLPIRRLADSPGGRTIIAGINAAGGQAAWSHHTAATCTIEGILFDERGAIAEKRTEVQWLTLRSPARVRIEAGDGTTVMAFGEAGAWGGRKRSDGTWEAGAGPGAMPPEALRRATLHAWRIFNFPFSSGEIDAIVSRPDPAPNDSLDRALVSYPPAPGDTAAERFTLGFDRDTGLLAEVRFFEPAGAGRGADEAGEPAASAEAEDGSPAGEGGDGGMQDPKPVPDQYALALAEYQIFGDLRFPGRRTLWLLDRDGVRQRPIFDQKITGVTWDPPINPEMFEPPPRP